MHTKLTEQFKGEQVKEDMGDNQIASKIGKKKMTLLEHENQK